MSPAGKTKPQWSEFLVSTTLGGLVQIHVSENIPKKMVWAVFFTLLSAATVWNTLPMVAEVSSYPIEYVVSDFEASGVEPFPAITIFITPQIDCLTLASAYLHNKEELREIMHLS